MIQNLVRFFKEPQRTTVGIIFALNGLIYGTFITRIPEIQNRLEISDGVLGGALFAAPLGALIISFFVGRAINSHGAGRITFWSSLVFALAFFVPIIAPTLPTLFAGLFILGISMGAMDISMNAAAAYIEENQNTKVMSTSHGLWSLGGMIGAGSTSILLNVGFPINFHLAVLSSLLLLFLLAKKSKLIHVKGVGNEGPTFVKPEPQLLILATIAFCIFLSEGAIADWSAVYLQNYLESPIWLIGLGFGSFSFCMAIGRFYGDNIVQRIGSKKILNGGTIIVIISFSIMIMFKNPYLAIGCFALAGMGFSCIIPVIFSEAGKLKSSNKGANIAIIGSIGYMGLLIGPPIIGLVSEYMGLGLTFGLVVILSAVAFVFSQSVV